MKKLLVLLLLVPSLACAQWSTDPNDPVVVVEADNDQFVDALVPDEAGGCYVIWTDYGASTDEYRIYAQHFNAGGVASWAGGLRVCTFDSKQRDADAVADGSGGVIVVWTDEYIGTTDNTDIYAQRLNSTGRIWDNYGVPVCTVTGDQGYASVTTDDAGGAYVAWTDDRGADYNIYAQHLDGTGDRQWASVGLLVCDATGTQYSARVVPDAAGGVFCCWMDRRDHFEGRVTGQHLDASGNALWIVNGRGLTWITLDISNRFRTMIPDQQGGFFLVVDEEVYENYEYLYDSYIYRIDADGDHVFTSSGLEIAPSLGHNGYASLVADGDGGVFAAAGYEGDNYYDREVRIQHFDGNGNDVWGHDGLTVSDPADRQTLPYLGPDGAGGIVVTWSDERTGYPAVYAQRLNASGLNLWPDEGVPVSGTAYLDRLTPVPAGGGWVKTLEATFSDIHLQRLGPYGYLDDPRPFITSVQDVPNDQGGEVTVSWDASRLDTIADRLVSEYSVWMRESEAKGAPLSDGEAADLAERKGWPIEEVAAFNKAGWGYVTQVPALLEPDYFAFAPTFDDSTAAGIAYTEYRVVAHSDAAWISWECLSALGYSVDNLEPGAPQALMALRQPDGTVDLTWSASGVNDEDLAYYLVYGAATPGFDLDETTYLGVTAATTFDHDPGDEIHYYRVTARDAHGNESAGSNEAEATALSATPDIVTITALHANRPNPFNPATVIAFDLPRAAHAELSIYAIDGSKVCTLVNGWQAPGRHEVRWNGRNEQDLGVAAGVYVYRLRAGDFLATRSMVLVR